MYNLAKGIFELLYSLEKVEELDSVLLISAINCERTELYIILTIYG